MAWIIASSGGFYDEVLREMVAAIGAALFLGNAIALYRRRTDAQAARKRTVAGSRPGSPVRGYRRTDNTDLAQAPLVRTVTYLLIGFVVMVAGIGALLNM
jgi:hypothetical protein